MAALKRIRRIFIRSLLIAIGLLFLVFCILTASAWQKNWIEYPRLDQERMALHALQKEVPQKTLLHDYQGILHSHSYRSHDSRGVLAEIIPAAQRAQLDFIFLSDHKRAIQDSFPRGYHGMYDGILIESGTESNGMMVSPMDSTILDWAKESETVQQEVIRMGGMVFYVHSEEAHEWGSSSYHGMEIYNIHTDFIDEDGLFPFLVNSLINGRTYKHWAYRELYNDQPAIWANWDSLNQHRRIVGMAAVDAHDNQSIRARYLEDGRVEWVGSNAKTLSIVTPGLREKLLLGKADTAGWVFRMGIDDYFHSFNFVNTHILADSLSRFNLRDHLLAGHAYIAFESLAEADGFQFYVTNPSEEVLGIMGDSIPAADLRLKALSPLPVQFQLIRNGQLIDEKTDAYTYEFDPKGQAGNYRLVARVLLDNEWLCWVMTNPIFLYEK